MLLGLIAYTTSSATASNSISRFGEPKYSGTFPYVNKEVKKGGDLKLGTIGTFDSTNPFIIKGNSVYGVLEYVFDPLMMRSNDEPFTLYAILAEKVFIAKDNSSITIYLNKNAKFQDGTAVTSDDVKYTYETLQKPGFWPRYKQFYGKIEKIEIIDQLTLKIILKKDIEGKYDPEVPLILCLARIVSKKSLEDSLKGNAQLVGSGPYQIKQVDQGRSITYELNDNYWAKDLPVCVGFNNFKTVKIEYFKNLQAHFLAFQAGEVDVFFETNTTNWETGYNFKAFNDGRVVKFEKKHERPVTVQTIIFNMKQEIFKDKNFRKALFLAFDFETLNHILFQDKMYRARSLFENTELAHYKNPKMEEISLILENSRKGTISKEMCDHEFTPPKTDGKGNQKEELSKASNILNNLGYLIAKDGDHKGKRLDKKGNPIVLRFMIKDPKFEKIALHYGKSLKRLGITLKIELVDATNYENKVIERDFDMIIHSWSNTFSPGNEQIYYFSRATASIKGSSNYIGMIDETAEKLATLVAYSKTKDELSTSVRALDRYVMYHYYMIPLAYDPNLRFAYFKEKINFPKWHPKVGMSISMAYSPTVN